MSIACTVEISEVEFPPCMSTNINYYYDKTIHSKEIDLEKIKIDDLNDVYKGFEDVLNKLKKELKIKEKG